MPRAILEVKLKGRERTGLRITELGLDPESPECIRLVPQVPLTKRTRGPSFRTSVSW